MQGSRRRRRDREPALRGAFVASFWRGERDRPSSASRATWDVARRCEGPNLIASSCGPRSAALDRPAEEIAGVERALILRITGADVCEAGLARLGLAGPTARAARERLIRTNVAGRPAS